MGHLINPISLRLSVNVFWNSSWVTFNNFNYNNLFKRDYLLFSFLNWFINKSKFLKFNILISHYKIYRVHNSVYVNLYYYASALENVKYDYYVNIFSSIFKKNKVFTLNDSKVKSKYSQKDLNFRIIASYQYIIKLLISNLYWQLLNSTLVFYDSKIEKINSVFFFNTYNLSFSNISVETITKYISLRLQKKYSLNWIIKPIIKDLTSKVKQKVFLGYKLVCSGRFTRKQIATYTWVRGGSVKLNSISSLIKYSESRSRLKYGTCGIKLWINYGVNNEELMKRGLFLVYPLYTPFKYVANPQTKTLTLYFNYWFYIYVKAVFLKLKHFSLYLLFLKIRINLLLVNIFKDFFKDFYLLSYKAILLPNNSLMITANSSRINYLNSINKHFYE